MKKETISDIINQIDPAYIEEATLFPEGRKMPIHRFSRLAVAAAVLLLFTGLGFTASYLVAEAREYRLAIEFFEENGLSTEGLSRTEVKEVYRDITTKSFTYEKTAEVIRQTISPDIIKQTVSGWEIAQRDPTPEELAAMWNKELLQKTRPQNDIHWRTDTQYVYNETLGYEVLNRSILECYQGEELLWSSEFPGWIIEGQVLTSIGTAVWGRSETTPTLDVTHALLALVDENGKQLWVQNLRHSFRHEYIAKVLGNEDGTLSVFSRGDLNYLCLSTYDQTGKELHFQKNQVGNLGIWNAAHLGDGYLVQMGNTISGDTALLYRLDGEGNIVDNFAYEADDCVYYLTDMAEFREQIYLSAYAVPLQSDKGGRHEIAKILEYLFSEERSAHGNISSEELTPLVRDNYTAVLLVCDPEGGVPKTFYSIPGSMGGALHVTEDGKLEWEADSITSTFFSPATSSFTIGGVCSIFRYTFDADGTLLGQADTGETVPYRR